MPESDQQDGDEDPKEFEIEIQGKPGISLNDLLTRILQAGPKMEKKLGANVTFEANSNPTFNFTINIQERTEQVMGNKNEAEQVGIQAGRDILIDHVEINQKLYKKHEKSIDLKESVSALSQLKEALKKDGSDAALEVISDVTKAEKAAENDNGADMFGHLKSGGKALLSFAKDIGTKVAVDVVKKAIGVET